MMKRYRILDEIRGMTLVSMILYHMMWDLVYIFGWDIAWYRTAAAYVWQQSICWTFIILSGFCFPLGRRKLKRGLTVFAAGLVVTGVTFVAMPEEQVIFGVLTLLGSCMIAVAAVDRGLRNVRPVLGMVVSGLLFVWFRNVNEGFFGFEILKFFPVPRMWYRDLFTTYLGFPHPGFFSTDYFSLLPWMFLFLFGYYLHYLLKEREKIRYLEKGYLKGMGWLGRNSLWIYLLHQPFIMLILSLSL